MLTRLACRSLWNRRLAVALTVLGIGLSTAMILGIERIRVETRESFQNTIAGTDLIIGARTSPVQLLLYSVFRIGDATNNIAWSSFEKVSAHPQVSWSIPISLGDSHRGYRVLGTTAAFFEHMRSGRDRVLEFSAGWFFADRFDVVLGADVARELGYSIGDSIFIAHGTRDEGLARHDNLPFHVSGTLQPTGTPVDKTVHVTLEAIEAIHAGWESGARDKASTLNRQQAEHADLQPEAVTAFFLGLNRRSDVFQFQRAVNEFPDEPLLAILPGVALTELWNLFSTAELALLAVAIMTVLSGMLGMVVGIFATLNERRREMAVLRSVGARPLDIASLLMTEATVIGVTGVLLGYGVLLAAIFIANPILAGGYGLEFSLGLPNQRESLLLTAIVVAAFVTGAVPAWRAYRLSLHDGLTARL